MFNFWNVILSETSWLCGASTPSKKHLWSFLRGILTPPTPANPFFAVVALLNSPAEHFKVFKKKIRLILWGRLFTPSTTPGGPSAPPGGTGDACVRGLLPPPLGDGPFGPNARCARGCPGFCPDVPGNVPEWETDIDEGYYSIDVIIVVFCSCLSLFFSAGVSVANVKSCRQLGKISVAANQAAMSSQRWLRHYAVLRKPASLGTVALLRMFCAAKPWSTKLHFRYRTKLKQKRGDFWHIGDSCSWFIMRLAIGRDMCYRPASYPL